MATLLQQQQPPPHYHQLIIPFPIEILPLFITLPVSLWLCAYFFYPSHHQHVLEYQRELVSKCLSKLGVKYSPKCADQTWNEAHGSFLGISTTIAVAISSSMTWIIEGRSSVAKILPPFFIPFTILYVIYIRSSAPSVHLRKIQFIYMLMNFVSALTVVEINKQLIQNGVSMTPEMLKRNIFSVTLICLSLFESLEDSLIVLFETTCVAVIGSSMHGHHQSILPILFQGILFMILIVFITLTSMRGRMNAMISDVLKSSQCNKDSSLKFYATAITSVFLFAAMYATTIDPVYLTVMLKNIAISIYVTVGILVWKVASLVDSPPTATLASSYHTRQGHERQLHVFFADSFVSLVQMILVMAYYIVISFGTTTGKYAFIRMIIDSILSLTLDSSIMAMMTTLMVFLMGFPSPPWLWIPSIRYNEHFVRICGLLATLAQVIILFTSHFPDTTILVFGITRILMLGIGTAMPFFDLCAMSMAVSLVSIMVTESHFSILTSLGLSAAHLLMALEMSLTRKSIMVMIQTNSETQRFVEHAMKQKFIGCLDAVEHLLKHEENGLSQEQRFLLQGVVRACVFGLYQTYYYALRRRFERLTDIGVTRERAILDQVVEKWKSTWADEIEWIKSPPDESSQYIILKRWELIRLVLHNIIGQNLTNIVITYSLIAGIDLHGNKNPAVARMEFVITRHGRKFGSKPEFKHGIINNSGDQMYGLDPFVAKEMHANCTLKKDGSEICLSFELGTDLLTVITPTSATTESPYSRRGGEEASAAAGVVFPPGLVFAVLDDIKLVRLNVIRYLIENLYASHDSFALGSTKHEALVEFVERCFLIQVDVALLDVHLEYDEGLVLGIEIAIELRKPGFKNTIILHSANEQSVALQRLRISMESIVDGFLEKRVFEKEFIERSILKAMENNSNRRRNNVGS
jgi:hypothetical protein